MVWITERIAIRHAALNHVRSGSSESREILQAIKKLMHKILLFEALLAIKNDILDHKCVLIQYPNSPRQIMQVD
jgi:hypothetical protein